MAKNNPRPKLPPIPLDGLKPATKKKIKCPTLDATQDIALPESIATTAVTAKQLTSGKFQKAILKFFATPASAALFNGAIQGAHSGNVQAMRLLADMYSYVTQKQGGVNILVNQNNANVAERRSRNSDGLMSFEQIARSLAEDRQNRLALPVASQVVYDITPDADV